MDGPTALAADSRSLDALRGRAAADPKGALREAAKQFEALFMREVLKSMRAAVPESGLTGGGDSKLYREMFDGQLAQGLAGRPGGLAEVLLGQLERQLGARAAKADSSTSQAPSPVSEGGPVSGKSAKGAIVAGELPGALLASLGAASGTAGPETTVNPTQVQFVRKLWPHALAAQQATGVRAEHVLGQAALESGWGRGEIRLPDGRASHNLFGIKAGASWKGATVDVVTTEYVNGEPRKQVDRFRAYSSYAEAFGDWASLIAGNARYGEVMNTGESARAFADGLQKAGYATDPAYADKLQRTIRRTIALRRVSS